MFFAESKRTSRSLLLALACSLLLHALALFVPTAPPRQPPRPPQRLQARLAPSGPAVAVTPPPARTVAPAVTGKKRLAIAGPGKSAPPPPESPARKREMEQFLAGLGEAAREAPSLAQRSLEMAHEAARQPDNRGEEEGLFLERIPDTPEVDPFSLEMYLDSLVRKLNRSAAFVKNDVRVRGLRTAALQVRIAPDGSLKSFEVIDAADQQAEIGFVRTVIERAVPFAAFPRDMRVSARSLVMTICIQPASWGSGGVGFTRQAEGKGC